MKDDTVYLKHILESIRRIEDLERSSWVEDKQIVVCREKSARR